jgi:hypothetical protein
MSEGQNNEQPQLKEPKLKGKLTEPCEAGKVEVILYPNLPDFRTRNAFWKVSPFVLLVRATCR